MHVHWLEQGEADAPPGEDWLSAAEAERLHSFRFAKRRGEWRLGRWTAKRAVAAFLGMDSLDGDGRSLAAIEIRPAPTGAPEAFLGGRRTPVVISLSHRAGMAACAVAGPDLLLGCDLEVIEPRSEAFAVDYFTAGERALVARTNAADRFGVLALLWSAKESVLKALGTGLRADTRSVVVEPLGDWPLRTCPSVWRLLTGRSADYVFDILCRQTGEIVRTMAIARSGSRLPFVPSMVHRTPELL